MGIAALKVHDEIFAMVSSEGHRELPKACVDAPVAKGAGRNADPNASRGWSRDAAGSTTETPLTPGSSSSSASVRGD